MKGIVFLLAALFSLTGCVDLPVKVTGYIKADRNINRNIHGRAAPIQLKLYHLKRSTRFRQANYGQLTGNDLRVLSSDLIKTETIIVRPNQRIAYKANLRKDVRHLGIVAAFRRPQRKQWKGIFTLSVYEKEKIGLKVTKKSVSIVRLINEMK